METKMKVKISSMTYDLVDATPEDEPTKISYTTSGAFKQNGAQLELSWDEPDGLGMDGCVTTLIYTALEPTTIVMHRAGDITSGMTFSGTDKRELCATTVHGMPIQFAIVTRKIKNEMSMSGGMITLDYVIEFANIKTERCLMRIDAKPVEA